MRKSAFVAGLVTLSAMTSTATADGYQPVWNASPYYSWTGCYIGGNGGGIWSHTDTTWVSELAGPAPGPLSPVQPRGSITSSGWALGGQLGCDYQFHTNWIIGIRGMWDGSNATGSRDIPLPNLGNFTSGQTDHADLRSFETVTGRLGFLVTRTLMLYGVGGMAWVQNRSAVTEAQGAGGVGPALGEIFTSNNTRTGYDAGAGLSWMLVPNWELWVEYDHMGFGTKTIPMRGEGNFTGFVEGFDQTLNVDKVLVGLNWRF